MHQLWLLTEPECKWFQLSSTFCIVQENCARSKKFIKKMFNQKFFPKPDRKLTSKLPLTLKLSYKYTVLAAQVYTFVYCIMMIMITRPALENDKAE